MFVRHGERSIREYIFFDTENEIGTTVISIKATSRKSRRDLKRIRLVFRKRERLRLCIITYVILRPRSVRTIVIVHVSFLSRTITISSPTSNNPVTGSIYRKNSWVPQVRKKWDAADRGRATISY